jgi:dipeptidase E
VKTTSLAEPVVNRHLLLVSSSRCHPHDYLDHCAAEIRELFAGANKLLFIPYARPGGLTWDAYTDVARERFASLGFQLSGVHEHPDPPSAVAETDGVFVGGGNTFVLLRDLYRCGLLSGLQARLREGMPYMGTSAGSNIAGLSIGTSNDMPIVHPPSFDALGAVPFNLNPHYPVARPDPTHKGETRDDRIAEFHVFNDQPVLALHEDGMLRVRGDDFRLIGQRPAIWFTAGGRPQRLDPGPISSELRSPRR